MKPEILAYLRERYHGTATFHIDREYVAALEQRVAELEAEAREQYNQGMADRDTLRAEIKEERESAFDYAGKVAEANARIAELEAELALEVDVRKNGRKRIAELEKQSARDTAYAHECENSIVQLQKRIAELEARPAVPTPVEVPWDLPMQTTTRQGITYLADRYGMAITLRVPIAADIINDYANQVAEVERLRKKVEWFETQTPDMEEHERLRAENKRLTAELAEAKAVTIIDDLPWYLPLSVRREEGFVAGRDWLVIDAKGMVRARTGAKEYGEAIVRIVNAYFAERKPAVSGNWREHPAIMTMDEYANSVVPYALQNHWADVRDALPDIIAAEVEKKRHEWAREIIGYDGPFIVYTGDHEAWIMIGESDSIGCAMQSHSEWLAKKLNALTGHGDDHEQG